MGRSRYLAGTLSRKCRAGRLMLGKNLMILSSRFTRPLAAVTAALFLVVGLPHHAQAASSGPGAPQLTALTLESPAAAVPGDTVTWRWRAREETKVVGSLVLRTDSDPQWLRFLPLLNAVQDGDGSWTGTVSATLNDYDWPSGALYVTEIQMNDGAASSAFSSPADFISPTVTVTGTEYQLGPRLRDMSFQPAQPIPGDTIRATFRAEDLQGIRSHSVIIKGPNGYEASMYNEHVDARQNPDGSWEWDDTIATSAEDLTPGTYWVASVRLDDSQTGSSSMCCYATPDESPYTFTVTDDPAHTTSVPVISGRAQVPYTLTADPGLWGPGAVNFSYQWTIKSSTGWPPEARPIEGATGQTYQLRYGLYQDQLQVRVTGTWPDGTKRTRFSEPITKILPGDLGTHKATVTGTAGVGNRLTIHVDGTWPAGTWFDYEFVTADGKSIKPGQFIDLAPEHLGKTLIGRARAYADGYNTGSFDAAPVTVVKGTIPDVYGLGFNNIPTYGIPVEPFINTMDPGWTTDYQWMRNGFPIAGATTPRYTPVLADIGTKLTLRVRRNHPAYNTFTEVYDSGDYRVQKVTWSLSTTATLSGTAKIGYALTAGAVAQPSGTTYTYQWFRGATAIPGATGRTYTPVAADLGRQLRARVTPLNPIYFIHAVWTPYSAAIAYGTLTLGTPYLKGPALVGATLTAYIPGYTSGTTLKRQWLRSGAIIPGAIGGSYRLTTADRGRRISFRVIASKPGYTTVTKTSPLTYTIR
jgi:hypothetical protein